MAAFDVILKYGFHLPITETIISQGPEWQKTIESTSNQDLITITEKIKKLAYKDAREFAADMMPLFERMIHVETQ